MATTNSITKLYPNDGVPLTETDIQNHIDSQNSNGWILIYVESLGGWYRFFWSKTV